MGSIGEKIRSQRKEMGLSLREAARRAGLNPATFTNIENGKVATIQNITRRKIEKALELSLGPQITNVPQTLGERIRQRREELGLTQAEVAKRAGLNRETVVYIENDTTSSSRDDTLKRLGEVLGIDLISRGAKESFPIGEIYRIQRIQMGMSVADLAKAAGVSRAAVSALEKGRTQFTRAGTLFKIRKALQIETSATDKALMSVGNRILMERGKAELSLAELSKMTGISARRISNYERGMVKSIPVHALFKIAEALQIDVNVLNPENEPVLQAPSPIGIRIRERRMELGLTIADLSKLAGVSRETVSHCEARSQLRVREKTYLAIIQALNLDPAEVWKHNDVPSGEEIRQRRKEQGLSIGKLSKMASISYSALVGIETGKTRYPKEETIQALQQALRNNQTGNRNMDTED